MYFRFWTGTRPSEAIGLRWGDVDLAGRRIRIRRSRVLGEDGKPKTGRSKRDIVIHADLEVVLRHLMPLRPAPDDFVFATPMGAPIDEANFYQREWLAGLRAVGVRPRPFYNTRHTYISTLLAAGAKPLFVCRQTGTSLEMIEKHYGDARVSPADLDAMMADAKAPTRNLPGTLPTDPLDAPAPDAAKPSGTPRVSGRAGDRDRTGDVQLGKLAFYH